MNPWLISGTALLLFLVNKFRPRLVKVQKQSALIRSRSVDLGPLGSKGVQVFLEPKYALRGFDACEIIELGSTALEIEKSGLEGIHCRDGIRVDLTAAFQVRVPRKEDEILKVFEAVGCQNSKDQATLQRLFEDRFTHALRATFKQFDFDNLLHMKDEVIESIKYAVGTELSGYELERVTLKKLQQTPLEVLESEEPLETSPVLLVSEDSEAEITPIVKDLEESCVQLVANCRLQRWMEREADYENRPLDELPPEIADLEKKARFETERLIELERAKQSASNGGPEALVAGDGSDGVS